MRNRHSLWHLALFRFIKVVYYRTVEVATGEVKVEIETLIVVYPFCNTYINEIHKVKSLNDLKITIFVLLS